MAEDPWSRFETPMQQSVNQSVKEKQLALMSKRFLEVTQKKQEIDSELESLTDDIARMFPEIAGTEAKTAGPYEVSVSRTETFNWDSDGLAEHFGGSVVPECVNQKWTVDKRKYLKLSSKEQAELSDFLTRKLNKPKVRVSNVQS
tara:strand:+ start:1203 stop:1637 length:435 start_codon:yes stop_codon:yes gene_type:complete